MKASFGSGAERSGVPQGCPPPTVGSAPERSGEAEATVGQLVSSAPVERSAAADGLDELFTLKCGRCFQSSKVAEWIKVGRLTLPHNEFQCPRCGYAFRRQVKTPRKDWEPFVEVVHIETRDGLTADLAQCNGPKAESEAKPRRRSGAQARNVELSDAAPKNSKP